MFLEISQHSQENTCARVSFLRKLQASGLYFIEYLWLLSLLSLYGVYLTLINDLFPSARNPNLCCYKGKRDYRQFTEQGFLFERYNIRLTLERTLSLSFKPSLVSIRLWFCHPSLEPRYWRAEYRQSYQIRLHYFLLHKNFQMKIKSVNIKKFWDIFCFENFYSVKNPDNKLQK